MTCAKCEELAQGALQASRAYYRLQEDVDRKYILQGQELLLVNQDVQEAERDCASAIQELLAHRHSHGQETMRPLGKRRST